MTIELPSPKPDISESSLIKIAIGPRRYGIQIKAEGYELKREPAKVLEIRSGPQPQQKTEGQFLSCSIQRALRRQE